MHVHADAILQWRLPLPSRLFQVVCAYANRYLEISAQTMLQK